MIRKPVTQKIGYSSITVEMSDITNSSSECIVNAANKSLLGGGGVDGAIHRAAGPDLLDECRKLNGCNTGEAKITNGYNLKAKYIIHTVGPIYRESKDPINDLKKCYINCLKLAIRNGIGSIDFPAISCGVYGFPIEQATMIAYSTVSMFLKEYYDFRIKVTFSCFNTEIYDSYLRFIDKYSIIT